MISLTCTLMKAYDLFSINPKDCLIMDDTRNNMFAQHLVEHVGLEGKNIFEALTVGVTWTTFSKNNKFHEEDHVDNDKAVKHDAQTMNDVMFGCHVDQLNDNMKG